MFRIDPNFYQRGRCVLMDHTCYVSCIAQIRCSYTKNSKNENISKCGELSLEYMHLFANTILLYAHSICLRCSILSAVAVNNQQAPEQTQEYRTEQCAVATANAK